MLTLAAAAGIAASAASAGVSGRCPTAAAVTRIVGQTMHIRFDHTGKPIVTDGWCAYQPLGPFRSSLGFFISVAQLRSLYPTIAAARTGELALFARCPARGPVLTGPCGVADAPAFGAGAFITYAQLHNRAGKSATHCDVFLPVGSGPPLDVSVSAGAGYRGDKSWPRYCAWAKSLAALMLGS